MILAGDVGGTKILLEVGDPRIRPWRPLLSRRYAVADFARMADVLDFFLAEWDDVRPPRARIRAAALGVAGPARGNRVQMTNRPWRVDGDALARRFAIPRVRVINDLAAAALGLAWLRPRQLLTLQRGVAATSAPCVVLGVGTGLGVAYLETGVRHQFRNMKMVSDTSFNVLPSEGGHVGFSPASAEQARIWEELFRKQGRVEAEHIVSGPGLERYGLDLFTECLANVAGDHALAMMAQGGVYLAGGVIARIAPSIQKERFARAFRAKGALSSILARIPVRAVLEEKIALWGAARAAREAMR